MELRADRVKANVIGGKARFWVLRKEPLLTMATPVGDETTVPEVVRRVNKHEALVELLREAKPSLYNDDLVQRIEDILEDEE